MKTLLLHSNSNADIKLLSSIAKKMGVKVQALSQSDKEDMGMLLAIKGGRTKKYVNTDNFVKKLRK